MNINSIPTKLNYTVIKSYQVCVTYTIKEGPHSAHCTTCTLTVNIKHYIRNIKRCRNQGFIQITNHLSCNCCYVFVLKIFILRLMIIIDNNTGANKPEAPSDRKLCRV